MRIAPVTLALCALAVPASARAQSVPVAAAGQDVYAHVGTTIVLNGSASSDPDGDPLSFAWSQVEGPAVTLYDAETAYPWFEGEEPGTYTFSLVVSDGANVSAADTVDVHLFPDPEHDLGAGCGCGSGMPTSQAARAALPPILALGLVGWVRRRARP